MKLLKGYKTYIVSALLVAVGLIDVLTGDLTASQFLKSPDLLVLLNGLGLAALRSAI